MTKKVKTKAAKTKAASKTNKVVEAKTDTKRVRRSREVKLSEADERLLGIVRAAKKSGISVEAVAKDLFGKRVSEIARPAQAVYFKVIAANKKLEYLGEAYRIHKRPAGDSKRKIELFVDAA